MKDYNTKEMLEKELNFKMEKMVRKFKENGLETIVKSVYETLMKVERDIYLDSENNKDNKANGYYKRFAQAMTKYLEIKVPRDRLSNFKPVFLEKIQDEDEKLNELAFQLYLQGLSTPDVEQIMEDVNK